MRKQTQNQVEKRAQKYKPGLTETVVEDVAIRHGLGVEQIDSELEGTERKKEDGARREGGYGGRRASR